MFYLHILGDPVLLGPDGPVSGRAAYKRRVALLAVLALARSRPLGRERLIGLLWPEHPADAARRTLSESLYVLRKELGEDVFVAAGDELGLNPAVVACDAAEMEAALEAGDAERAAALYRGPLLDGFYVADAPEFERWTDAERARLAQAYARAVESLAVAAEGEGSALRAVDWWRRLAAHDPYSGRVALRLMAALEAAGERVAALRAGETHAALLRAELELEPDEEVTAYLGRLRAEPVRPAPASSPAPPARSPSPPSEAADPASSPPAPVAAEAAPPIVTDPPSSTPIASPAAEAAYPSGAADAAASVDRGPVDAAHSIHPPTAMAPRGAAEEPATRAGEADAAPSAVHPPSLRRRRWRMAGAAAALAVLVLAAGWMLRGRRGEAAPAGYDPRRIAVLYLDDHSPGGSLQYLASGLTEMLIHELSQVQALDVISRNGVKPFRDGRTPLDSIVAALRVGSVVEGSVQQAGDSVRVVVQLIDAASQSHLESRTVTRPAGDVLALQDALAREVSAFLRRRIGEHVQLRQAAGETRSPAAQELVLRARQDREDAERLAEREDPRDRASAARLLHRADSLLAVGQAADPAWIVPGVLRGWVALDLSARAAPAQRQALLRGGLRHAAQALARHPGDPRALELRGALRWEQAALSPDSAAAREAAEGAERDLRAAVSRDPSLAGAWSRLSQLLRVRGRFAEGEMAARRALDQDAYLAEADDILHRLYLSALTLGDYPRAGEHCGRGARQFAADWRFVECRLSLMREDPSRPADPAAAWRLVAELDRLDPPAAARAAGRGYSPVFRRVMAAAVLARAGQGDSARAVLARARRDAAANEDWRVSLAYDEAHVRLLLGERAEARRILDAYLAARPAMRPYLARDPLFRGLLSPPASSGPGPGSGTQARVPS